MLRLSCCHLRRHMHGCRPSRVNMSTSTVAASEATSFDFLGATASLAESLHAFSPFSWATDIIIVTVFARGAVTLPLAVFQAKTMAILTNLKPELNHWAEALKQRSKVEAARNNLSIADTEKLFATQMSAKRKELLQLHNCRPYGAALLPLVQIPLWVTMSLTLRRMSGMGDHTAVLGFSEGGLSWFNDLSAVDPTWILPISIGLLNVFNLEMMHMKSLASGPLESAITFSLRAASVIMVPISCYLPSGIVLYWAVSAAYGVLQSLFMQFLCVRRFFNIPPTAEDPRSLVQRLLEPYAVVQTISANVKK